MKVFKFCVVFILAQALMGCWFFRESVPGAVSATLSTVVIPSTPLPTRTNAVAPSLEPRDVGGSLKRLTLGENEKTITLLIGERICLDLGAGYDWTVIVEDEEVLDKVWKGFWGDTGASQGVYEARQPGKTELTATGDPTCLQFNPPCSIPSILFRLEVEVE